MEQQKREHYGAVRLDWGTYPLGTHHDAGGCPVDQPAELARPDELARVAHYKRNMEQRGGNNPYQFEGCPERLRYEVGTGCMNPACMCRNCHGDCKCNKNVVEGFGDMTILGRDLKFWLIAGAVAFLTYRLLGGKKMRK